MNLLRGLELITPKRAITREYVEKMDVRTLVSTNWWANSRRKPTKVVVGRWLATKPKILVDEPTRGVDVGAKAEIYSIMNDLVKEGSP